jgi:hypothetical protein
MTARSLHRGEVPGIILSGDLPSLMRTINHPVPNTRFLSKPVDTDALLLAIKELSASAGDESESARVVGKR